MRVKHILNRLSVGARLKIVYERITLTRFSKLFIFVAFAHCLVQIALQTTAFSFNSRAANVVSRVISESDIPRQYAFVDNGELFVCSGLPDGGDPFDSVCWAFAGSGVAPPNVTAVNLGDDVQSDSGDDDKSDERNRDLRSRDLSAVPTFGDSGDVVAVNITGLNSANPEEVTQLSPRCIQALNWPSIILRDARREDISFLFYQVWLLGISLMTILNESIPHLVAALVTHGLSTGWSAFQVSRTGRYEREYRTLIVNDTCNGVDILPGFWAGRMNYFIPILVLNAVVLVVSLGVSLKLFNVYSRQTFNRVGDSKKMNLMYSHVLLFSVFLQLSAFFTICGSALWIDVMSNGILKGKGAQRVIFTIASVVEFPWVILGWISFRREYRIWSLVFIIIGLVLSAAWTSMFANVLYRWAMQNFPFFATLSITAFIVLVITVILALICRLQFGKGLPQYLKTEEKFDDSSFIPVIVSNKRHSNLVSVIFPDKRTSALRKVSEEKKTYTFNPYERRKQWPPSDTSVIDIKAPSVHPSEVSSVYTSVTSAAASDGHGHTTSNENARDSILSRARAPFLRFSNASKLGKGSMNLRFSAFTSNSSSSDLEVGVPEVPVLPHPRMSKTARGGQSTPMTTPAPAPTPTAPEPARIAQSTSTRTAITQVPIINVIPASFPRSHPYAEAGLGNLSMHVSSSNSQSNFTTSSSSYVQSELQSMRASPPGRGIVSLPWNPRAYRI